MAYNPFHKNAYLGNGQYDQLEVLRKSKDPLINYEGLYQDQMPNELTYNPFKAMTPGYSFNTLSPSYVKRKSDMFSPGGKFYDDLNLRMDFEKANQGLMPYNRWSRGIDDPRFANFSPRVGQTLGYQEADQDIDLDSLSDPFANNIFEQNETISTPNITVAEAMIDEDRIPGRIQESVPNYQNWFEKMMSGVQDKFSNFKMPSLGIMGLINAIGNKFEDRQLTGDVMDEYGNMYSAEELNKMNARGGYYTDPARSARRRTNRIRNMLNRQKAGKKISTKNLETLQKQADDINIHNIQQYTGRPLSGYRMSRPASERQYTGPGRSGMGRSADRFAARGGLMLANGGLASLFTRRG